MLKVGEWLKIAEELRTAVCDSGLGTSSDSESTCQAGVASTDIFDALVTHPGIRSSCRALYAGGHYAQSVEEAYKFLTDMVQRKSGLHVDGKPLMEQAFSLANPRLRIADLKTETGRNLQLGYMGIFSGSISAVRNPRAHRYAFPDSKNSALELLVMANHLAEVVAKATKCRKRK